MVLDMKAKIYFWRDPNAEDRQSYGIEFWVSVKSEVIIGYCSEFDLIWDAFDDALAGRDGRARETYENSQSNITMTPANFEEIKGSNFERYISGEYEV